MRCSGDYSLADLNYMPTMTRLDHLQLSPLWERRPRVAGWFDYDPTLHALMIEKSAEFQDRVLAMVAG